MSASYGSSPFSGASAYPGKRKRSMSTKHKITKTQRVARYQSRTPLSKYIYNSSKFRLVETLQIVYTGGGMGYIYAPSIQNFSGITAIQQSWDSFRVDCMKISFLPQANTFVFANNAATVGYNSGAPQMPIMYAAVDKNDPAIPTSANQLLQYGNCKYWNTDKRHTVTFTPKMDTQLPGGAGNPTVFEPTRGQSFLSFDYPQNMAAPILGLKTWLDWPVPPAGSTLDNNITMTVMMEVYFTCKTSN